MLIFFDGIMIYSGSVEVHREHIHYVFEVMMSQQLYAKMIKCEFVTTIVEYLGHLLNKREFQLTLQKSKQ